MNNIDIDKQLEKSQEKKYENTKLIHSHHIKEMKLLDKEIINFIHNMSDESKIKIMLTYNEMFECLINLINKN